MLATPLWEQILPHVETPMVMPGSTEVGDVSQITPTGQLTTCCWPLGTPGHSWQIVASSGSSIGAKGMLLAAKALALAGLDLLTRRICWRRPRPSSSASRTVRRMSPRCRRARCRIKLGICALRGFYVEVSFFARRGEKSIDTKKKSTI